MPEKLRKSKLFWTGAAMSAASFIAIEENRAETADKLARIWRLRLLGQKTLSSSRA